MNKTILRTTISLFVLVGLSNYTFAQTEKESLKETKSYFNFDINYVSNSVYFGRKDSLTLPYITPSLSYYDKSGFYINAGVGYVANSSIAKKIDYGFINVGYDFSIIDKLTGSAYASKSFYSDSNNRVNSSINTSIGTNLNYDAGFLQFNTGVDIYLSEKTDLGLNMGVNHPFYFGKEDNLFTINPSFAINFSTLHFYESYTSKTFGRRSILKNPNILTANSKTTVAKNELTLLDYEFSAPVNYEANKWGAYFTPTLAIPKNPIYTTTTSNIKFRNGSSLTATYDSTPNSEKNLENTFFVEVGIYFKF